MKLSDVFTKVGEIEFSTILRWYGIAVAWLLFGTTAFVLGLVLMALVFTLVKVITWPVLLAIAVAFSGMWAFKTYTLDAMIGAEEREFWWPTSEALRVDFLDAAKERAKHD